jgi:hypothetical protein
MWRNRYVTGVMHAATIVPVFVAGAALAGPVVKPDLHYGPDDGPRFRHHFNAGTADALARPPGGYWHEQPLRKVTYRMVSPRIDYESEGYVLLRRSDVS